MASRTRHFTLEDARRKIVSRVGKAGVKGATSPVTPKTAVALRAIYEQAFAVLAEEGALVAIVAGGKTKYFLPEHAPSAEAAAAKIERFVAVRHPALLAITDFKKALGPLEKPFLAEAVQQLEFTRRLVRLVRGKTVFFVHADSLRLLLNRPAPAREAAAIEPRDLRAAYQVLVAQTGFPAVEIAALRAAAGLPLDALKDWLRAEHREGRVVFGLGDWSLADEAARAAAVELRGDRHLLVRLED